MKLKHVPKRFADMIVCREGHLSENSKPIVADAIQHR